MKRYIIMNLSKWEGSPSGLAEGNAYNLISEEKFVDDDGNHRYIKYWKGDVHIEVHDTYLYEVSYQGGFGEKSLYVYADSKRGAVAKAFEVIGSSFDSIECHMVVEANKVLYAD